MRLWITDFRTHLGEYYTHSDSLKIRCSKEHKDLLVPGEKGSGPIGHWSLQSLWCVIGGRRLSSNVS